MHGLVHQSCMPGKVPSEVSVDEDIVWVSFVSFLPSSQLSSGSRYLHFLIVFVCTAHPSDMWWHLINSAPPPLADAFYVDFLRHSLSHGHDHRGNDGKFRPISAHRHTNKCVEGFSNETHFPSELSHLSSRRIDLVLYQEDMPAMPGPLSLLIIH